MPINLTLFYRLIKLLMFTIGEEHDLKLRQGFKKEIISYTCRIREGIKYTKGDRDNFKSFETIRLVT